METSDQRETGDQREASASTGPVAVAVYTAIGLYAATWLTALYGPHEQSERAFRLLGLAKDKLDLMKDKLDWLKRPEPAAHESAPSARGRARQGRR